MLDLGIKPHHLESFQVASSPHVFFQVVGLPLMDGYRQSIGFFPVDGQHQPFF
jgi:hypothetical protein